MIVRLFDVRVRLLQVSVSWMFDLGSLLACWFSVFFSLRFIWMYLLNICFFSVFFFVVCFLFYLFHLFDMCFLGICFLGVVASWMFSLFLCVYYYCWSCADTADGDDDVLMLIWSCWWCVVADVPLLSILFVCLIDCLVLAW